MSELKMSDVFELPVRSGQLEVYGANSNPEITFKDIKNAAAHAINIHDSLVEEVERLSSERNELVKLFEGLERVTDIWLPSNVDSEHVGEAECLHSFRGEYLSLLAKIKGNDNA